MKCIALVRNRHCGKPTNNALCNYHSNKIGLERGKFKFQYKVKPSKIANSGLGLFYTGNKVIKSGKMLPIYGGHLISKEKADNMSNSEASYVFCGKFKKQDVCIDGRNALLPGKFANDCQVDYNKRKGKRKYNRSTAGCNARFTNKFFKVKLGKQLNNEKNWIESEYGVNVNVTSDIKKGDEILINYGNEYWDQ